MPLQTINRNPLKVGSIVRLSGFSARLRKVVAIKGDKVTLKTYGTALYGEVIPSSKPVTTENLTLVPNHPDKCYSARGWYHYQHITLNEKG